jgi:hypothetical protein
MARLLVLGQLLEPEKQREAQVQDCQNLMAVRRAVGFAKATTLRGKMVQRFGRLFAQTRLAQSAHPHPCAYVKEKSRFAL